jgi:hypothetical protein
VPGTVCATKGFAGCYIYNIETARVANKCIFVTAGVNITSDVGQGLSRILKVGAKGNVELSLSLDADANQQDEFE